MAGDKANATQQKFAATGRDQSGPKDSGSASFGDELDFARDDRLHWLEADGDEYVYAQVDTGRVLIFALIVVLLLGIIGGGVWWMVHSKHATSVLADGSTLPAPLQPYKEAPKNPGGKTLAGTGDTSYAVAQGLDSAVQPYGAAEGLSPSESAENAKPIAPSPQALGGTGGVSAQLGAYGTPAAAEAAWSRFVGQGEALKGVSHRVVEGKADIGKVYRLQVSAGSEAGANALCSRLKASGIPCQVKH
jgi:hypothetical protein